MLQHACWSWQGCGVNSQWRMNRRLIIGWQFASLGKIWLAKRTVNQEMRNEPLEVTLMVTGFFEKNGVPYFIGGSLASTLYGMVRTTQDSDIVAEIREEHIPQFVMEFSKEFYLEQQMIEDAVRRCSSFNIIHLETMFKVDIFIPEPSPFIRSEFTRVQNITVSLEKDVTANFASPEDTILAKLTWYRGSGDTSENQWRDILGVLRTRAGDLDVDYLRFWAKELKVDDLLERALSPL
jgi:hypothetical protein